MQLGRAMMQAARRQMHVNCRDTENAYFGAKELFRQRVPDDKVDWGVDFPDYCPPDYTAPSVLEEPGWADKKDPKLYTFNAFDSSAGINRVSYVGPYSLDADGRPMNPCGRTGLKGRGLLGKWGPNHAGDCIITRTTPDGKHLQFISIMRKDRRQWAIPGGMVDPGETDLETAKRELKEEALGGVEHPKLVSLWGRAKEIGQSYVDDPRNTDNAWIETTVVQIHDENRLIDDSMLKAESDAFDVAWKTVEPGLKLYATHRSFVEECAKGMGC